MAGCSHCELGHGLGDVDRIQFCARCRTRPPKGICLAIRLGRDRFHPFLTSSHELMTRAHRAAPPANSLDSTLFRWCSEKARFTRLPAL